MWVDSHCHLNRLDVQTGREIGDYLATAREKHVARILSVAVNLAEVPDIAEIVRTHQTPDLRLDMSVGIHPLDIPEGGLHAADWEKYAHFAQQAEVVALGEMGLDFYRETDEAIQSQQIRVFCQQLDMALACNKPVIIHMRGSAQQTLAILGDPAYRAVRGVLHCFTEDWSIAEQALEWGWYISLSGIVTFKNAHTVHAVAARVPLERLLIETDAPYLAPHPFRGQSNQPAWVTYTGSAIARIRGLSEAELAACTAENYARLFGE